MDVLIARTLPSMFGRCLTDEAAKFRVKAGFALETGFQHDVRHGQISGFQKHRGMAHTKPIDVARYILAMDAIDRFRNTPRGAVKPPAEPRER